MAEPWKKRAVCPCGETFRATFGELFFVHEECCPECGADKRSFKMHIVRWVPPVRGPWWQFWPEITPGYWQPKEPNS